MDNDRLRPTKSKATPKERRASHQPIGSYALLSDCNGAALVSQVGSVDWLCLPRFDSPALFARLLDHNGGHWAIGPNADAEISRRYIDGTMTLETTFSTPDGELILIDVLATGPNNEPHGHELGAHSPFALLREVRCTRGRILVDFSYDPRPEYGLIASLLLPVDGGVLARGGATTWLLSSELFSSIDPISSRFQFDMTEGETHRFSLQYASSIDALPSVWTAEDISKQFHITNEAWQHWSNMHQSYDGPWREQVHHSGRVLQALTYFPTGAIVAAPTTSLPEEIGGIRNWDYRYTWVRDASFTLDALWIAACPDEAYKFIDFLAHAALTKIEGGRDMQIVYGIAGEHDLAERELNHLSGWCDSAPVRVGNEAWGQIQIDVYGELLAAVDRLRDYLGELDSWTKKFLVEVAEAAARCWKRADQGIWEVRAEPRHYLYSKLMCWVAMDRAIALAEFLDASDRVDRWKNTREQIRHTILTEGWSDELGAFRQVLGEDTLDAANLVIPMVGFLPGDDPRVLGTIDAIEKTLTDQRGLVYRYRSDDNLPGGEGSFLLCTFWLAEARALAGQPQQARRIFENAISYSNDLGLLSEQVDTESGRLLGNFPQAFSHIGLVTAAWAIHQMES